MKTNEPSINRPHPDGGQYALVRDGGFWQLTFEGRPSILKHKLGMLYVAYLLGGPPRQPVHGVTLALKARERVRAPAGPAEAPGQQTEGLEDLELVRRMWRRQSELERVLEDPLEIEPVKAEVEAELEALTEHLRQSRWLSLHGAVRCARAVAEAIKHLHAGLAAALDAEGRPHPVLRAFAAHLHEHLLVPSGRGGRYASLGGWAPPGCFIYVPPRGVTWSVECGERSAKGETGNPKSEVRCAKADGEVHGPESSVLSPAAEHYLSRFLGVGFVLALLVTGCAGPRPLKGGKAATTRKPAGVIEQTVVQGENASQPTKQDQETVKVRTYTLPAATRIEQSQMPVAAAPEGASPTSTSRSQPSTINPQPSSSYILSAPMPVVEREETRARTELGAAQKDTARELGAKLSSLKGIVWVGVGLFVFGLASLVYPPLKVIVASVTTSAALMLGGVALIVLPTMVVGNELLILGVVGLVVGAWFLAHRHGQLSGLVAASTAKAGAEEGKQ